MTLSKKAWIYSIVISLVVGAVIMGYMIFLMPSMYMDYKSDKNLAIAKDATALFKKNKSLEGAQPTDGTYFGIIVPKNGYDIGLQADGVRGTLKVDSHEGKASLDRVRSHMVEFKNAEDTDSIPDSKDGEEFFSNILGKDAIETNKSLLDDTLKSVGITFEEVKPWAKFEPKKEKLHMIKDGFLIESSVEKSDTKSQYTVYIGVVETKDNYYVTFNSTISPNAEDIKAVVLRAIPVFIPLIILLTFGIFALFSRKLIDPINALANDANTRRSYRGDGAFKSIEVTGNDEISQLAMSLNSLYESQEDSYQKLMAQNKAKEIFMRASSHQLKTPIAAASLLLDGMIGNVGKYENHQEYLPQVKDKVVQMSKIVDQVLDLNHKSLSDERENVDVTGIVDSVVADNLPHIENKGLSVKISGGGIWNTSSQMFTMIFENGFTNGIKYTEAGGYIDISINHEKLVIKNGPASIDEKVSDNVFQPFVSSAERNGEDGHGLGLYIAKYYADILGMDITLEEDGESVVFTVIRKGEDSL